MLIPKNNKYSIKYKTKINLRLQKPFFSNFIKRNNLLIS